LQVLEHEQRDQSSPDLNLEGVGAGAHEGLDAQVLLQRFEEQLSGKGLARCLVSVVSSPSP